MYDAALAELDPLDLPAPTRMGFVNTVLGHVFGSGLALLEENTMRSRSGMATDEDLANAASPYLERIATQGSHPHSAAGRPTPERLAPQPQTFETILEWLLNGLESLT